MNSAHPFLSVFKQHNLKITPQRTAIYNALAEAENHPSADAVYQKVKKEFPNISFDTVNRTLMVFSEIGLIEIVEGQGDPRRFDPRTECHHHFYCVKCGKITDFFSEELDQIEIPPQIEKKFTVIGKRMVLKGYCPDCKNRVSPAA